MVSALGSLVYNNFMIRSAFLLSIAFLGWVMIGDIFLDAGIWIVVLVCLIVSVWFVRQKIFMILLFTVCFSGFLWSTFALHALEMRRDSLGERVGWDWFLHTIEWVAGELLSTSEYNRRYRLFLGSIDGASFSEEIALVLPTNLSVVPGDRVVARWKFSFPGDTIDYAGEKNLWNQNMVAEFRPFQTQKYPPEQYGFFVRLQQWFDQQLRLIFPPKWYQLLSGIILGQRTNMDTTLREELKNSGLMHLMVVSGGNVMMLIVFLSLFIRSVPVFIRMAIITGTIISFVLLVGGDAPVWRAALMGIIGYGASLWWYQSPRMLLPLLVACFLALWNPLSLIYDIGLQLSFLSVLCIVAWGKLFTWFFAFLGPFFSEAMALTLAATIGTAPITLYYFGTFSLVGPLANLLAAPAIPVLMYGGILTLGTSLFSATLATWIGYLPWIATTYLYDIIHIFGSPTWSTVQFELGIYRTYGIVVSLAVLFLLLIRSQVGWLAHSQKKHQL